MSDKIKIKILAVQGIYEMGSYNDYDLRSIVRDSTEWIEIDKDDYYKISAYVNKLKPPYPFTSESLRYVVFIEPNKAVQDLIAKDALLEAEKCAIATKMEQEKQQAIRESKRKAQEEKQKQKDLQRLKDLAKELNVDIKI